MGREQFDTERAERSRRVLRYIQEGEYLQRFRPPHLQEATLSYVRRGGKSLRAMVLLLSCGAVGGEEEKALPAAAAVELYHLWTLVHDDIIDRDDLRRNGPTVHHEFYRRAAEELGYPEEEARHYGLSLAILAGDLQHSWSLAFLSELHRNFGVDSEVVLYLIRELETRVISTLLEGETLDFQYAAVPFQQLDPERILDMLWKKTGNLYEFCGLAGALIGLNRPEPENERVRALASFASKCGIAFQLQDDLLGVIGDPSKLGKPVGSDILEGKKTLIAYHTFHRLDGAGKRRFERIFGARQATPAELEEVVNYFRETGGLDHVRSLARRYLEQALELLRPLPASRYKELLALWADSMLNREL